MLSFQTSLLGIDLKCKYIYAVKKKMEGLNYESPRGRLVNLFFLMFQKWWSTYFPALVLILNCSTLLNFFIIILDSNCRNYPSSSSSHSVCLHARLNRAFWQKQSLNFLTFTCSASGEIAEWTTPDSVTVGGDMRPFTPGFLQAT